MDFSRLELEFESELATYAGRHAYLLRELQKNPLRIQLGADQAVQEDSERGGDGAKHGGPASEGGHAPPERGGVRGGASGSEPPPRSNDGDRIPIQVIVGGATGVRLRGFSIEFPEGCPDPGWQVLRRGQPVTAKSQSSQAELLRPVELYPAMGIVATSPSVNRGAVRSVELAASYPFEIEAAARLRSSRPRACSWPPASPSGPTRSRPIRESRIW
jgi:hypothetical protein